MKKVVRNFIELITKVIVGFKKGVHSIGCSFFLVGISIEKNNQIEMISSVLEESKLFIKGVNNKVEIHESLISKSHIAIEGSNNSIVIDENVKLRSANIQLRGDNCSLKIGLGTTFGGIRIVNVGNNNQIIIGKNCLFADHIELWASDTHSILDENGKMINPEKPVTIGDRVWVGSHVKILKGVTIENDSIIGMGSLVTKNISKGTLNAGSPAKRLRGNVTWELDY